MQRVFNFDQDQIALNAWEIAHGRLTVLGPQTSNTSFFTGPLIYYLAAIFYRLTNFHPIANAFTAVFAYILSFWLIKMVLQKLFKSKLVILFLTFYALSPFFVQLDRITWNPNFSFLSGSLALTGLLRANYISLLLWMFFAYQSSYSGFVIVPILLGCLLLRWCRFRLITAGFLGMAASLLPLLLFDLKHDFMNFNSLKQFIINIKGEDLSGFLTRILTVILINFENFSKIFTAYFYPQIVLVVLGLVLFICWYCQPRSFFSQKQKQMLLLWMMAFPIAGLFYQDDLPEYYFLMQLPALVMMMSDLIYQQLKQKIILIFSFITLVSLGVVVSSANGYALKQKYQALEYIYNRSANRPVEIIFDIDYSEQFGWNYLLKYWQINNTDREKRERIHLVYPFYPETIRDAEFGKIGVYYVR